MNKLPSPAQPSTEVQFIKSKKPEKNENKKKNQYISYLLLQMILINCDTMRNNKIAKGVQKKRKTICKSILNFIAHTALGSEVLLKFH